MFDTTLLEDEDLDLFSKAIDISNWNERELWSIGHSFLILDPIGDLNFGTRAGRIPIDRNVAAKKFGSIDNWNTGYSQPYPKNSAFITYEGLDNEINVYAEGFNPDEYLQYPAEDAFIQIIDITNGSSVAFGRQSVSFKPKEKIVYGFLAWYEDNRLDEYLVIRAETDKLIEWGEDRPESQP